jgi:hypothetical protein
MPSGNSQAREQLVEEYRQSLVRCQELYRASAEDYVLQNPEAVRHCKADFVQRMLDLHRGLALKVFVEIAQVQSNWAKGELRLAEELIAHCWGKRLRDRQIREFLAQYMKQAPPSWDSLVGPFGRLASLRSRIAELQTVVMRMANLVAKVDGEVQPDEIRQLRWMQAELRRALERAPTSKDDSDKPAPSPSGSIEQAAQQASNDSKAGSNVRVEEAIEVEAKTAEQLLKEALDEIHALIGLPILKEELRELVNFLKVQKEREKFDLPTQKISLHAIFSGNPGTGKTTVARLLGHIYGAMGILKNGHLIETDRSGLVAEYAGQTGPKTNKIIDRALDGVLFIDEAYSLVAEEGEDPYGAEAVQTLLKRMEDDRERLIVILAGYPEPMERLLSTNPGLSSRFTRHFHFQDYTAPELGRIFEMMCVQNQYELPALTRVKLLLGFQHLLANKDEHFGNGRLVRNTFEKAIGRLANRIAGFVPLTREMLTRLEPGDIVMKDVPAGVWGELTCDQYRARVDCPGCQKSCSLQAKHLGRTVQCPRCQRQFPVDWGQIEAAKEGEEKVEG